MNVHIPRGCLDICTLKEVGSRDEARTAELEEKTFASPGTWVVVMRWTMLV